MGPSPSWRTERPGAVAAPVGALVLLVAMALVVEPRLSAPRRDGDRRAFRRLPLRGRGGGRARFGVPGVLVAGAAAGERGSGGLMRRAVGAAQAVGVAPGGLRPAGHQRRRAAPATTGPCGCRTGSFFFGCLACLAVPTVLLRDLPRRAAALAPVAARGGRRRCTGIAVSAQVDWILQPVTLMGEVGRMYPPATCGVLRRLSTGLPSCGPRGRDRVRADRRRGRPGPRWWCAAGGPTRRGAPPPAVDRGRSPADGEHALAWPSWSRGGRRSSPCPCALLSAGVAVAVVAHRLWDPRPAACRGRWP